MKTKILIKGASEHNLKNIDLEIPRNKLVVFTGVSGSGKSSLAFDTLYAEGQRRYVESLSAYARQFLGQMEKPKVDYIEGLSPAISIEQKAASKNPRSTVGTVTEIYDYLRVLYARVGKQFCHNCGDPVGSQTVDQMIAHLMEKPAGTKLQILAPLVQNRKGEHKEELEELRQQGFVRVMINNQLRNLEEDIVLDKKSKHDIDVVVDRIVLKDGVQSRLADSLELALKLTEGLVKIEFTDAKESSLLSAANSCARCNIGFEELSPQHFSFNSPIGACPVCNGLGYKLEFDPDLVVPDPQISIMEGAVAAWGRLEAKQDSWTLNTIKNLAKAYSFSLTTPWYQLEDIVKQLILFGSKGKKFKIAWQNERGSGEFMMRHEGVIPQLERRMHETTSEDMRRYYMLFLSDKPCPECDGRKLKPSSLAVKIAGKAVTEITSMSVAEAFDFFNHVQLSGNQLIIAEEVLKEIRNRLEFLHNVGLHYLSLDRRSPSLSGGESQRIRLASQIGSQLVGVMYILDEPSIGLHQRDNTKLIKMLCQLRDLGNTVIVVEHDEDTMRSADKIVDFGPRAGIHGGQIVATGKFDEIVKNKASLTGAYLSGRMCIPTPEKRVKPDERVIAILGATHNNLKEIDVEIPIGLFVCITGVSGSGKSSLINQTLSPFLHNSFFKTSHRVGKVHTIKGIEHIDKVISIDQQPIGRTPRSNPCTYIKLFDPIRNLFSELPASKMRGYKAGRFSFNVKGGRCEACEGAGVKQIEMHFMADIYVTCEVCKGKRYNHETLSIRYKGKNIAEVLDMDVQEAVDFFANIPSIHQKLNTLHEVGLDYIKLGQPSTTLSGGEAQRIKLSRELSKTSTGKTLYLLDEPTTGLHFDDINKLLKVLQKLVVMGNTVVVIEHNLDVIKCADWVIDLGPEGGDGGGEVLACGTPEDVMKCKKSSTGNFLKTHYDREHPRCKGSNVNKKKAAAGS
ncbi:MAG: excinuclease ABC subunit UvrA [Candidatus Cloacimonadaceae bacterium]|nr:excinuclease ABC subunit UvrA [Candidatus Cloacimonadaceae bacterium]MDP3114288.1 excinuclease ABC subunit UvrA [Candidatus Cloacimonadaceae bacterium]